MPATGFRVVLVDGPAAGWEYVTFVEPPGRIAVAPVAPGRGEWTRVFISMPPWPGQAFYDRDLAADPRGDDEDVRCEYREAT